MSIDLGGHQAADLVLSEVEDIAEQRIDAAAILQRGLYGALGHDDLIFLDEASQLDVRMTGAASFSIARSKTVLESARAEALRGGYYRCVEFKRERIDAAIRQDLCPQCGRPLQGTGRVGTGRIADGSFCDLRCYGDFYEEAYREKAAGFVPSNN